MHPHYDIKIKEVEYFWGLGVGLKIYGKELRKKTAWNLIEFNNELYN